MIVVYLTHVRAQPLYDDIFDTCISPFFSHARYRRIRCYWRSENQKTENSKFPLLMTREHPVRCVIVILHQAVSSPVN